MSEILTIDCRQLQPPEPMVKVMQAALALEAGQELLMIHRHEPGLLFSKLEEKGFAYKVSNRDDGAVEILISRKTL